jgi:uncharacterized protein YraI
MRKLIPITICLLLAACSLPLTTTPLTTNPTEDINNQAATLVAMTLNALATPTQELQENTPLPTPTLGTTRTPTPTITPTYSVPMLTVNEPTNCRTGPGQSYDLLFTLLPGASVEIVGSYPTNNYWTVKVQGLNEPCWMWGEYATTSGSVWTVPTVVPPPTTTASPPTAPGIASWDYLCGYSSGPNATVNLKWTDRSDDESGYRIYRNDQLVTELPANTTAFTEVIDVEAGQTITYRIEAFNSAGSSSSSSISFSCQ